MLCRMSRIGSNTRSAARDGAVTAPNTSAKTYEMTSATTPRISENNVYRGSAAGERSICTACANGRSACRANATIAPIAAARSPSTSTSASDSPRRRVRNSSSAFCMSIGSLVRAPQSSPRNGAPTPGRAYLLPRPMPLTVNGVTLFTRRVGSGPLVVVLHGGPGAHHDYLLPQYDRLARGRELFYYDQRGGGQSPGPRETPVGWRGHVAALAERRQALGFQRLTLFRDSWGGLFAVLS